ncbi:MAG: lipocalin [Bacteroidia bacterium]|nr:lipocalin [Bacteroidia bacterium]
MKTKTKTLMALLIVGLTLPFLSCSSIPKGVKAVDNFEKDKYLGKWYEIARFDFRFERNMNNTTANYSLNENGTIKVVNRGFNYKKQEWTEARAKAKFVGKEDVAMLKVSFFGPFYSGYNVIALDKDYKYALVSGQSLDYLWILSRTTTIPDDVKQQYLKLASDLGYKTENLIWVEHNKN